MYIYILHQTVHNRFGTNEDKFSEMTYQDVSRKFFDNSFLQCEIGTPPFDKGK